MRQELDNYVRVCDAIALLFQPFAEVVLHELKTETVIHIAGNFSKRVLGEPSMLSEIDFRPDERLIGPYEKINWDGRTIKAISIVLPDHKGKPLAVLCINVDLSEFHSVMRTLSTLIRLPEQSEKPPSLFKEDWHERINEYIQQWTNSRGVRVSDMTRAEKRELVLALSSRGAFSMRNSAPYVSRVLGIGRATVYKYINEQ
ncbi:putative transcriptional regulator YheO [Rhizobium sp. BK650]|uniref:helix-turn-helix transcriptional regulator n=1 Tax=Rhizobium sp. BK650 TaxID=2586990 RepID=UPI00184C5D03|nr:PAS domain-containing protein [Rhizobium sp. BK650]MBB3660048.1 putative transcriptional regulator YheO [Rhizobium sp. BK650]